MSHVSFLKILMLYTSATAFQLNVVFYRLSDYAGMKYSIPYISPSVANVTVELMQKLYPALWSNVKTFVVLANDTEYVPDDPCEISLRSFPKLMELYGRNAELHSQPTLDSHHATIIMSGDFCPGTGTEIGRFAAAADLLFISSNPVTSLSNVANFPTTLNLTPTPMDRLMAALKAVMNYNNWTRLGVICAAKDRTFNRDCTADFGKNYYDNVFLAINTYKPAHESIDGNYTEILRDMKDHARIILIMMEPAQIRKFLIAAYDLRMLNGEYVFLAAFRNPVSLGQMLQWKAYTNDAHDIADDYKVFAAYQSTIVISDLHIKWKSLESDGVTLAMRISDHAAKVFNRTISPTQRNIAWVLLVDAMFIFSMTLQRLLPVLDDLSPASFIQQLLGKTYSLPSRQLELNSNGQTVFHTPILRINTSNGEFEEAAQYSFDTHEFHIIDPELWLSNGSNFPPDEPTCGFDGTKCVTLFQNYDFAIPLAVVIVVICTAAGFFGYRLRKQAEKRIFHSLFMDETDAGIAVLTSAKLLLYRQNSQVSVRPVTAVQLPPSIGKRHLWRNRRFRKVVLKVTHMHHPNIGVFYGIYTIKDTCSVTWQFSDRGNIDDALHESSAFRDEVIRLSLLSDLVQGIGYIHESSLQFHGSLSSDVCFIDDRYNLRIAQTGCTQMLQSLSPTLAKKTQSVAYCRMDDIRGFGRISQKFLSHNKDDSTTTETSKEWSKLIDLCLSDDPERRPSISALKKDFIQFHLPNNIIEYVVKVLGKQAAELESRVLEKTQELIEEAEKVDSILMEILPKTVIGRLRNKEVIVPETFDSATVLFSDIPEFTNLVTHCSPLEAIALLNATHSDFDQAIGQYDVYKVETINDSYMIASGIPVRNGTRHAAEMCLLAVRLLTISKTFRVTIQQESHLGIRIGINSGSVVAGVIGSRMPRYCLFGDTVNSASRMESSGCAGKSHISQSVESLIRSDARFILIPRGKVAVKGKGEMETFWLEGALPP